MIATDLSILNDQIKNMTEERKINFNTINTINTNKNIVSENLTTNKEAEDLTTKKNIYRYKFSDNFTSELLTFSKIHQYDNRKDYKEAWTVWLDEYENIVLEEVKRLEDLNYIGDIKDKMFKSSRYYFRKKIIETKKPFERRVYINVQKKFLQEMDKHITEKIKNNGKPSDNFDDFCQNNIDLLKEEINILCKNGFTNPSDIKAKMKKTYKNRYYLSINKK
jgi:hypothetical protein